MEDKERPLKPIFCRFLSTRSPGIGEFPIETHGQVYENSNSPTKANFARANRRRRGRKPGIDHEPAGNTLCQYRGAFVLAGLTPSLIEPVGRYISTQGAGGQLPPRETGNSSPA